jgi:hypothetical protein
LIFPKKGGATELERMLNVDMGEFISMKKEIA